MRIIFLSDVWTVVLCFLLWPIFQVGAALLCLNLPDRFYSPDSCLRRTRRFEKDGLIYDKVFRVSRWKHLLPDGARVWSRRGYQKRRLESFTEENLTRFLVESARGELTHWLGIVPFWIFGLFAPPEVPWMMLGYALLVNMPCIIAQRYNRPRIQRLIDKKRRSSA